MNMFPAVDPIPLPAPVWLFKALHILTLALHFCAVELLLGGLLAAVWLNYYGSSQRKHPAAALRLNAAAALARRLPVVMTYVINLGVPPLLFAQVLYGRALYTSSVLIGMYWIAIIVLLTLCYWLLYQFSAGAEAGAAAWWKGLLAWLLAGGIAKILVTNMTLMLRPEVWGEMYASTAAGTQLPPYDVSALPRWLFMLTGGFWVAGLWMIWLAGRHCFEGPVRTYLAANGGRLALVMVVVQAVIGWRVFQVQTPAIQQSLMASALWKYAAFAWLGAIALVALFGAWAAFNRPTTRAAGWISAVLLLVTMLGLTVFRDGLRDVTLLSKGYDVWNRTIVTNWSVVGLFLFLFVVGLGAVGWLISVMMRARPVSEKVV